MTRRVTSLACIAVVMLAFAGCRDRSTAQDHQDELCAALGKLDGSVTAAAALVPGPSVGASVRKLKADMQSEFATVQAKAKKVTAFKIDSITTAYNEVQTSLNGVSDSATLTANQDKINKAAGDFSDARLALFNTAGCG